MFCRCHRLVEWMRRQPRTGVLGATLLVLLGVACWRGGRYLWAAHHLRGARQALEQRDFDTASAHLAVCLAVWPEDAPTHLLAARCARRAGRYEEAERHLFRCRALKAPSAETALEAALLDVQRGQLGETENYLKRTITPDHPDAPLVLEALALGYVKTDRLGSLLECTDLWLQVQPNCSQALRWRGYAWEGFRNPSKALDCYQRAVAADPGNDAARLGLAHLLLRSRASDALEQFEQLRPRHPQDPAVLLGLVRCYQWLARPEEAERLLDALLARDPHRAEALTERGKLALDRGRPSEAEGPLRQAVAGKADDRDALYHLILCLQQLGKEDEAGTLSGRLKKLDADLARLDELIARIGASPNDPNLRREAGLICLRYGRDEDGLHWLFSALDVAPKHSPTHLALADYFQRQGHPDRAAGYRRLAEPRP